MYTSIKYKSTIPRSVGSKYAVSITVTFVIKVRTLNFTDLRPVLEKKNYLKIYS